jgi:hypothetical protein
MPPEKWIDVVVDTRPCTDLTRAKAIAGVDLLAQRADRRTAPKRSARVLVAALALVTA